MRVTVKLNHHQCLTSVCDWVTRGLTAVKVTQIRQRSSFLQLRLAAKKEWKETVTVASLTSFVS